MKNKKVVPVIVNGELYDEKESRDKNKPKKEEKIPQASSPASNIALTILGIILIVYGVYSVINKDNKKEEPTSNITSNVSVKEINKFTSVDDYINLLELSYDDFMSIFDENDIKNMTYGLKVKDISNNAKMALAAKNINHDKNELEIKDTELNMSMYNIFGNVSYNKEKFNYSNLEYTYNNETERYYLLLEKEKANNFNTYTIVEKDNLIVRVYTAYTSIDNAKSYTLNKQTLKNVITKENINNYKDTLKYFEYVFSKNNDSYILESITIK